MTSNYFSSPGRQEIVVAVLQQFLQPKTLAQSLKMLEPITDFPAHSLILELHRANFLETVKNPEQYRYLPAPQPMSNSILGLTAKGKQLLKTLQGREMQSADTRMKAESQTEASAKRRLMPLSKKRTAHQKRPIQARAYERWTAQEERRVINAALMGLTAGIIAKELERQETAVVSRVARIIAGKTLSSVQAEVIPQLFAWYAGDDLEKWRQLVTIQLTHAELGSGVVVDVCAEPVPSMSLLLQNNRCESIPLSSFATGLICSLSLPADFDLRAGQPKSFPFFLHPVQEHNAIKYYVEYHAWRDGKNERFDGWSKQILQLKKCHKSAINTFFHTVNPLLGYGFTICCVPSHSPLNTQTGIRQVSQMLAQNGRRDATACLVRVKKIKQLSRGGVRSAAIHLNSIKVVKPELIQGQRVLVIDDVTTSGYSLLACKTLLLDSGASEVECFALARTVN